MQQFKKYTAPSGLALSAAMLATPFPADNAQANVVPHKISHITLGDINTETATSFEDALEQAKILSGKDSDIVITLDSVGGSVQDGWDILDTLETSFASGYKIKLVCVKAASMAGSIFAGFSGPRYADTSCQFMTHAPYIRQDYDQISITMPPIYWPDSSKIEETLDTFSNSDEGETSDVDYYGLGRQIPFLKQDFNFNLEMTFHDFIKIDLDYPFIMAHQKEALEKTQSKFAKLLAQHSCAINHFQAYDYFQTTDKFLSAYELLERNIADEVVQLNSLGQYEVVTSDDFRPDCAKKAVTEMAQNNPPSRFEELGLRGGLKIAP